MKEIMNMIIDFRNSRGWNKTDNPADLVKSIFVESAELLENFQWSNDNFSMESVQEEIADVLMYTLALIHDLDLDVEKLVRNKIEKNKIKYPINSK